MSRMERFFLKYAVIRFILVFVIIIDLLIALFSYMLDPEVNFTMKAGLLCLLASAASFIYCFEIVIVKYLKIMKNHFDELSVSIYKCNTIVLCISHIISLSLTVLTILMVKKFIFGMSYNFISNFIGFMLILLLIDTIIYRKCLNSDTKIKMNKVKRLFIKYNIELFILGSMFLEFTFSYMFVLDYDFICKILILFVGCLVSIPMLCVAVSKSLRGTRIICFLYSFLIIPIALYVFIYDYIAFHIGISTLIMNTGLVLIPNVIIYRSYLYIKYKNELYGSHAKEVGNA